MHYSTSQEIPTCIRGQVSGLCLLLPSPSVDLNYECLMWWVQILVCLYWSLFSYLIISKVSQKTILFYAVSEEMTPSNQIRNNFFSMCVKYWGDILRERGSSELKKFALNLNTIFVFYLLLLYLVVVWFIWKSLFFFFWKSGRYSNVNSRKNVNHGTV